MDDPRYSHRNLRGDASPEERELYDDYEVAQAHAKRATRKQREALRRACYEDQDPPDCYEEGC